MFAYSPSLSHSLPPSLSLLHTLLPVANTTCSPNGKCYVSAWCDTEQDDPEPAPKILHGAGFVSVFARVNARFTDFGIMRQNYNSSAASVAPGYNQFVVKDMVQAAGIGWTNDVKSRGTIIAAVSTWNCNLDLDESLCQPVWSFVPLDTKTNFSQGINFRYANKWRDAKGVEHRDLIKVYGVHILFLTAGEGRRFSAAVLFTNIGAGLGLLTLATVMADFVALYFLPKRRLYEREKYELVNEGEDDDDNSEEARNLI